MPLSDEVNDPITLKQPVGIGSSDSLIAMTNQYVSYYTMIVQAGVAFFNSIMIPNSTASSTSIDALELTNAIRRIHSQKYIIARN